jgi:ribulose 1,5-bisphosphate synthetase/thiazole synthase
VDYDIWPSIFKLQKFDLIVIGSGSGLDVANAAHQHGLEVAVIEKGRMGGLVLTEGVYHLNSLSIALMSLKQ